MYNDGNQEQREAIKRDERINRIRAKKWYKITEQDITWWDNEALRVDARWNPELAYAIEMMYDIPAYSKGKPTVQILDRLNQVIATPTHWMSTNYRAKPKRRNIKYRERIAQAPNTWAQLKAVITGLRR